MTIPLTGPQGLFTRLGSIFGIFKSINSYIGTTVPPKVNTVDAEYATTDQNLADNLYSNLLSYQSSSSGYKSTLQNLAQNTVVQMANDDMPQTSLTSLPVAMNYLINQMILSSSTVKACLASATVTPYAGNTGNAVVVFAVNNKSGRLLEDMFAETIVGTVTQDAQSGGAISGSEFLSFQGQYAISDPLSWLYPVGSGCNASVQCINPTFSQSRGNQNYLYNSNYELWNNVPNVPDGWLVTTGTPGTTIKQSTSIFYDGLSSLNFVGNGSELTTVYQSFAATVQASGTITPVLPVDIMAFNAFIRVDSTPAAGILTFSLVDSSNTILTDVSGNSQTIIQSLTSVSTTWISVTGRFRTPRVLPSQVRLQIKLTTALTAARNLYIDRVGLAQPYQLYVGGPFVAAFSGNVPLIMGDYYTGNVYNDYGGQFQYDFDRFFGMRQMQLLIPSSGSPTILDSLIS